MEEIKTIDDVLKMDITTNISTKQLQDAYKITQELNGIYYGDYDELSDDQLKYKIAYNFYYLSRSDTKEKQRYLNKAYEFNDLISSNELDDIDIGNLNFFVRCSLIKEFTELGEEKNLDKAYTVLKQVLKNSNGIIIDNLIGYTSDLLKKYKGLNDSEKNQYKINILKDKLKELENKKNLLNNVPEMDITDILREQLQNAYKITQELMGECYDNYNKLSEDQLKYKIAYNFYYLSRGDKQKKQKYLNKAYEFNNLISSDKFNNIDITNLNFFVRCSLIKEFTELGEEKNLDKAYTVLKQVLKNSNGIIIDNLIGYTSDLLKKYKGLNDSEKNQYKINILKDKLKELENKKKLLNKALELDTTPDMLSIEQLQNAYKITQELMGECYDNYKELTDDQLKYDIACNLYYLSLSDTKEKERYLNKAYEFNDLISSNELDDIDIGNLNFHLRRNLIEEFTELGEQENLDKAYTVFEQVLNNPEEIDIDELINYASDLLEKYKELDPEKNSGKIKFLEEEVQSINKNVVNTPVTLEEELEEEYIKTRSSTSSISSSSSLEEESRKLSSVEKIFDKVLEGQGQQTSLGSHN